ncbi:hypothetical protein KY332_04035 [Candidatus Woesearchaeota archaeon]|nr:hypothetical protein [Candidatus Woesearchaeota archaeon]
MGYKKVAGTLKHATSFVNVIRLHIDISKNRLKKIFTGDFDLHKLKELGVRVYIPKIKNKKRAKKQKT